MSFFDKNIPCGVPYPRNEFVPKNSWSELVGNNYMEVVQIVQREAPDANVYPVPNNTVLTQDYRSDRIFVKFDYITGVVTEVPRRG
jgi:hypothetical protein